MSIRALIFAASFIATPALAQTSAIPLPPPAGANYSNGAVASSAPVSPAYAPPPVAGPQPGGLARADWLNECERRLNATASADVTLSPGACQSWWTYYQHGGAPDPTYGYAIPVSVTETVTPDCPETLLEKRVIQRRIIKRRVVHDKRIAI